MEWHDGTNVLIVNADRTIVIEYVGAGLKLSICAGLKLTGRLHDVVYNTAEVS